MNRPSGSVKIVMQVYGSIVMLHMVLGNGLWTDFGASQCIPMGPCRLTRRLMLDVVMPLENRKFIASEAN